MIYYNVTFGTLAIIIASLAVILGSIAYLVRPESQKTLKRWKKSWNKWMKSSAEYMTKDSDKEREEAKTQKAKTDFEKDIELKIITQFDKLDYRQLAQHSNLNWVVEIAGEKIAEYIRMGIHPVFIVQLVRKLGLSEPLPFGAPQTEVDFVGRLKHYVRHHSSARKNGNWANMYLVHPDKEFIEKLKEFLEGGSGVTVLPLPKTMNSKRALSDLELTIPPQIQPEATLRALPKDGTTGK